jgi:hypothetical protein
MVKSIFYTFLHFSKKKIYTTQIIFIFSFLTTQFISTVHLHIRYMVFIHRYKAMPY